MRVLFILFGVLFYVSVWSQTTGPFAPAANQSGSTAVPKNSSLISAWAASPVVNRGFLNAAQPSLGQVSYGTAQDAGGAADGEVISLGDGGTATYAFNPPLQDGPGADIAIFENGLSDNFLELAFVEISSDGQNFYRFPAVSLTDTLQQVGAFGTLDPTQLHNLAGKYRINFGVPFDFAELDTIAPLNLSAISHIRVTDVIGSLTDSLATRDQQGRPINDPYPTAFASGGFDLDALAVLKPNTIGLKPELSLTQPSFYPNPCRDRLFSSTPLKNVRVFNQQGQCVLKPQEFEGNGFSLKKLPAGIYWVQALTANGGSHMQKIHKLP